MIILQRSKTEFNWLLITTTNKELNKICVYSSQINMPFTRKYEIDKRFNFSLSHK